MQYNIEELKKKYNVQPTATPVDSSGAGQYDVEALKKKYLNPTPVQTKAFDVPDIETRQQKIARYKTESADMQKKSDEANSFLGMTKNFGKALVANIAAPEVALGNTIAKLDSKPRTMYLESIQQTDKVQADLLRQIRINKAAGKDTTKLEQIYNAGANQRKQLEGGLNEANTLPTTGEAVGQLGGTALDLLSAGTYGKAKTATMSTFKLAPKVSKVQAITSVVPELSQVAKQKSTGLFSKKGLANVTKGGLLGYTSDVTMGLQNNEENPYAAGVGTLIGTGIPALSESVQTVKNLRNPQTHLNVRAKEWEVPDRNKTGAFDNAKDIQARAKRKGLNITQEISEQGFERKNHIVDNKLDVKNLVEKVRKQAGSESSYLDEATKLAEPRVLREPSMSLYEKAIKNIDQTSVEGMAIANRIRKEGVLQKRDFGFNDIYKKKQFYGSNSKWKMGMPGDGIKEKANAELAKVFKEKLLEQGKKAGVPVDDFLKMQEKQYLVADYLDELDGTKVYRTPVQTIRRGILKAGGAILGAKGGLYGSVGGYHGGGVIDTLISNFPTPIRNAMLKDYQRATPSAKKAMEKVIQKMVDEQGTIKKLPSSKTIYQGPTQGGKPYTPNSTGFKTNPIVETSNYSNQRSVAIPNNIPNTTIPMKAIPKTILPIKKSSKQSGMIRNPLATNVKIHSEDLGEMRDFLDVQVGKYNPGEKAVIDNEINVRRYVEDKFGKNTDNLTPKQLAVYVGKVVDKYYKK